MSQSKPAGGTKPKAKAKPAAAKKKAEAAVTVRVIEAPQAEVAFCRRASGPSIRSQSQAAKISPAAIK